MTIDKFAYAPKADASAQFDGIDGKDSMKQTVLVDLASSTTNADYHKAQTAMRGKSDANVAAQIGDLKIYNTATDMSETIGSAEEFRRRSQGVFSKVDRDHDGVLSSTELSSASTRKSFSPKDQQVIESMARNIGAISMLSDDEIGPVASGVSMSDLDQFAGLDERAKTYEKDSPIENWFGHSNMLRHVDADGDGYLTRNEIDARLNNKAISKPEAAALERMRSSYDSLMAQSNDEWGTENSGVTRRDIDTLVRERQTTRLDVETMQRALTATREVHARQAVHER